MLSVRTQIPDARTRGFARDTERLKGMRTPVHQRHRRPDIPVVRPRQRERPEVDTAWEGQQPTGERIHPSLQVKFERPSKHG
jgi:hypothetical protein